jgi:hypothetical protein
MTEAETHGNGRPWLGVALIAALCGGTLRLLFADQGLWADEVQSVELTQSATHSLLARTGLLDVHPPLYYLLLKGWSHLGGTSDLWMRGFSLFVSALTVGVFVLWAKEHLSRIALGFAASLLVFSTWHIHYSIEVRSYALLVFLVILLTWRVERWVAKEQSQPYDLLGIVLLSVATGLTHYYGLFCLIGLNVFVFTHSRVQGPRLRRWAAWQGATVALLSWWLPFFFIQAFDLPPGFTSHLQAGPEWGVLIAAFGPSAAATPAWLGFVSGLLVLGLATLGIRRAYGHSAEPHEVPQQTPAVLGFRAPWAVASLGLLLPVMGVSMLPEEPLTAGHPILDAYLEQGFALAEGRLSMTYGLLLGSWMLLFAATRLSPRCPKGAHPSAAPFVVGTVLLIGGFLHLMQPSLSTRNLLVLLPMIALLAGQGIARIGHKGTLLATVLVIALSSYSLTRSVDHFTPRPDFRGVAEHIRGHNIQTKPQIFVVSAFDQGALNRYLTPLKSQGIMQPSQLPANRHAPIYVALTREAYNDRERFQNAFLQHLQKGFELSEEVAFREVQVLVFIPRTAHQSGIKPSPQELLGRSPRAKKGSLQ